MIKAVLFDLDGVLVDACDWHYAALNAALQEIAGFIIDRDEHMEHFNGLPTLKKLGMLVEDGRVQLNDVSTISDLKQDKVKWVIEHMAKHDEGKMSMLKMLRHWNIRVGCVTNSIRETTELMLTKTGQLEYIEIIVSNEDIDEPKPDPAGYLKAMRALSVLPNDTLVVEDSPKGIDAAMASGAHVLTVKDATEVNWALLREKVQL